MYYKVLMEGGHMGAGKSYDMTRYLRADNLFSIFDILASMPRLKSKGVGKSVKLITPVSRDEFVRGKDGEAHDPYLMQH